MIPLASKPARSGILILAAVLIGFSGSVFCASPSLIITPVMQYEYAVKLWKEKDYPGARVEFKRFLHFFPESEKAPKARLHLALCLFGMKEYPEAARAFNEIILSDDPSDVPQEAYFYQSRALEKMGNPGYAQIVLQNFLKLTDDPATRDRIQFSLGRLFLTQAVKSVPGSLKKAEQAFRNISGDRAGTYRIDQYLAIIDRAGRAPKKDPALAGVLAGIPGAGFAYCGRYKDAFTTLLVNAGLLAAAYQAWDQGNEPLAGVIGFVEAGFYSGNIYGSISAAHKHNRAQTLQILDPALSIRPLLDRDKIGLMLDFDF